MGSMTMTNIMTYIHVIDNDIMTYLHIYIYIQLYIYRLDIDIWCIYNTSTAIS